MSADDAAPQVISAVFSIADIVEDPLPLAVVMEAARSQGPDMQGLDMPAPALAELLVDPAGDVTLAAMGLTPPEDGIPSEPLLSVALNRAFDSDNSVTVCVNSPLDGDWMWLPLGHSLEL
jgi:hypothetical protein